MRLLFISWLKFGIKFTKLHEWLLPWKILSLAKQEQNLLQETFGCDAKQTNTFKSLTIRFAFVVVVLHDDNDDEFGGAANAR